MSVVPFVLLSVLVVVVLAVVGQDTPGEEDAGYGFLLVLLVLGTLVCEFAALVLGVAGVLQWGRGRAFAFLGIACSVLAMVTILSIAGPRDVARVTASLLEPAPKVHVSPGKD